MDVRRFTKGDLLKHLRAILIDYENNPINLAGMTVTFRMTSAAGVNKINNKAAVIIDAANGVVEYSWDSTDINTSGTFYGQFIRTYGGETDHHPVGKELKIVIEEPV